MSIIKKIIAKRDARIAAGAQKSPEGAGERRKGLLGWIQRANTVAGKNFSSPKMMAGMATQAQANMPRRPMAQEAPAGAPTMRKGGKISAASAVHKHERAKHKGQPLTKMAKGGSASRRADGCATKGKTKGRFV
jgi:hypothetical protein